MHEKHIINKFTIVQSLPQPRLINEPKNLSIAKYNQTQLQIHGFSIHIAISLKP